MHASVSSGRPKKLYVRLVLLLSTPKPHVIMIIIMFVRDSILSKDGGGVIASIKHRSRLGRFK